MNLSIRISTARRDARAASTVPPKKHDAPTPGRPTPLRTETQVSAGGVVYRDADGRVEIVLVAVGPARRWQLPKGLVDAGESPEVAAAREVREEGGVQASLVEPLETIEYWYVGDSGRGAARERVRFHKHVHFFLFAYVAGDPRDHDREVVAAEWVPIDEAAARLAFAGERRVVAQARARIAGAAPP